MRDDGGQDTVLPSEHRDEAYDQQFAKVVPRPVGAGIGDVIEGGEEDIHTGNGLQKGDPHPRFQPAQDRKNPQIRSNPKRDSTAFRDVTAKCHIPEDSKAVS